MTWIPPFISTLVLAPLIANVGPATATISFGCRDSMISDRWREMVLNFHNKRRGDIARGLMKFENGTSWPKANNMNRLFYNCNLEKKAQKGAEECTGFVYAEKKDENYGFLQEIYDTPKDCNIATDTERVLGGWWNQSLKQTNINYDNVTAPNFGLMAYYKGAEVACTHNTCNDNGKTTLLCLYNVKAPVAGTPLYRIGDTCTETCREKCVDGLCREPVPVYDPSPCVGDRISFDMRTTIINMHNYYRRSLATGWTKDSKGSYAPRAKAMPKLAYNCTLGVSIKPQIDKCPETADPPAGAAQNYIVINNGGLWEEQALEQAMTTWWREYEDSGPIPGNKFTNEVRKKMGNFANMANDKVTTFGCDVRICKSTWKSVVVCRYNKIIADGDLIYEEGEPCTGCPDEKCAELGGLCPAVPPVP